jgi:hypothetical protein
MAKRFVHRHAARPVMIAPLALSVLHRQRLLLGPAFLEKYPHPWLVWESGPQRPSAPGSTVVETRTPRQAGPAPSRTQEPVAFPLTGTRALRLGRAITCDLVIDDVTVSRELGLIRPEDHRWFFDRLSPAVTLELSSGLALSHGDVWLTFLSSSELVARLDALPGAPA